MANTFPSFNSSRLPAPLLDLLTLSLLTLPMLEAQDQPTKNQNAGTASRAAVQHSPAPQYEITGRCVDAESGLGLARCLVSLTGHMATGHPLNWGVPEFIDPEPVLTGSDGHFRFFLAAPHGWDAGARHPPCFQLSVTNPLRTMWFGELSFPDLVKMGGLSCGDIPLALGRRPTIRVLDTMEVPQEGITLDLKFDSAASSSATAGILKEQEMIRLRSDQSGTFQLPAALRPGTWMVSIADRVSHEPLTSLVISADESRPSRHFVVVKGLEGKGSIAGSILDTDEKPVSNVELRLQSGDQGKPSRTLQTNDKGEFVFPGLTAKEIAGPLHLGWVYNNGYDGCPLVALGEDENNLELPITIPAVRSLSISVKDDLGGEVPAFSVHAFPLEKELGLIPTRVAGRFSNGTVDLKLRRGAWKLAIVAEDRTLAPSDWIELSKDSLDEGLPQVVTLKRRILKPITICDADGVPLAGVTAHVFEGVHKAPEQEGYTTAGGVLVAKRNKMRVATLYEARTSASGEVVVAGPHQQGSPATIVLEQGGQKIATHNIEAWNGESLTLRVQK